MAVADTYSCTLIHKHEIPRGGNKPMIHAYCRVEITTNTTNNQYVTAGIPLTDMFTAGNADDTEIDVLQPIWGICGLVQAKTTNAQATPARFRNGGTTAATQFLQLYETIDPAAGGGANIILQEYTTTADLGAASEIGATDEPIVIDMLLVGAKR